MTDICSFCESNLDGHPGELHDIVVEGSIFTDTMLVGISIEHKNFCDFRCLYGCLQNTVVNQVFTPGV
jgi:hypothetical protein